MNNVKKIVSLLFLFVLLISCSIDNESVKYHLEFLKIESVDLPDTLILGETHEIVVRYKKPSSCHTFNTFYYDKYLNERTIAVQCIVTERNDCITLDEEIEEAKLNFYVTNNGSYIFKFWQGEDDNGEDIFLEIEVPVED